jgi:hypothetical protein
MAVMAREGWSDERLDDLSARVDSLERRMDEGFKEMREEFRAMRSEMAASQRTLVQMAGGIWVTSLVGFLGVIATVITQG